MAIEREEILEAALVLINEAGLDKFTTRKLAERLGVQQPALYWHFRSKSDLLDALNELMLERLQPHRHPAPGETWEEFMLASARSFRLALLSVRNGARINAGTRPTARQFADAELQLRLYVDAGFSAGEALNISIAVTRYVVGFVLEEQDERERTEDEAASIGDPIEEVAQFPLLSIALKPLFAAGTVNTEGVFEAGLGYLLAGIRESLAARGSAAPTKRSRKRPPPPPPPR
jgi:TetR/AcrR family tetracycline transcriptional repressor